MWRTSFIFWLLVIAFVVIDYRLFYWQVLSSGSLRQQAASQYFLEFQLPPTRGSIFDQNGNSLAINQPAFLVYAQPKKIEDVRSFAAKISATLGLEEKEVVSTIAQPDRFWVALGHKIEQPVVEKLKKLSLSGLGFEKEDVASYFRRNAHPLQPKVQQAIARNGFRSTAQTYKEAPSVIFKE